MKLCSEAACTRSAKSRGWWTRCPTANIGLATGHRMDVVDIDGPAGLAYMYSGDTARVDSLEILGIALTTAPGKRHLYIPPGLLPKNAAKKLHPEIDWRVIGGYVVAPPSVVGGAKYRWLRPLELT